MVSKNKIYNSKYFRNFIRFDGSIGEYFPGFIKRNIRVFLERGKRMDVMLTKEWHKKLQEFYRDGNQQIIDRYGLPLEKYNYPV